MTKQITIRISIVLALLLCPAWAADQGPSGLPPALLEIQSVSLPGKTLIHPASPLILDSASSDVTFHFGPVSNAVRQPVRMRHKLEGLENAWQDGPGEMFVYIRFFNDSGERVGRKDFPVHGESTGWNGTLETSVLTHRRETIVVPPRSTQLEVIISSAGPPDTVGLYAVDDFVVSKVRPNNSTEVLLQSSLISNAPQGATNQDPPGWIRDGLRPPMATIIELGNAPKTPALAILDNDPAGHAEWRSRNETDPHVTPGDNLVIEWNELYSMGLGGVAQEVHYNRLPPGEYAFRVAEFDVYGRPTGVEAALAVSVPRPLWETPRGWALLTGMAVIASTASVRYLVWRRVRRATADLRQQQALEQERLRIARDIHDDLGARVTQISLLSGLAQNDPGLSEAARTNFDRISRMSRDLVSALYETVWAVNPENDSLEAVGNYLCQRTNEFCIQANLRCRLEVDELPRDIEISSQARHNIIMAVKEAAHNVIKHARASQITVRVAFSEMVLTVAVADDGKGFEQDRVHPGNGWPNIRRRLEDIGGTCRVESVAGQGTTVHLRLPIHPLNKIGNENGGTRASSASAEGESADI